MLFRSIGFLSTGRPVIAWYDRTNMNLVLSYGNSVPLTADTTLTTSNLQWQTNTKIVHTLAGSHVDMVIDGSDNIHLAYYDVLNGGLYYALIPPKGTKNAATPANDTWVPDVITDTQYVRVDTYLSAGTRIMLNVRQETHTSAHPSGAGTRYVPYISYFHASFDETKNSVRVAWRSDFTLDNDGRIKPGSDESDGLTGAWEVMTVPAENVPASGQYICNGVPASGTIGGTAYTGSAGFNYNATVANGGYNNGNITKTMLVGYMTDKNYEGAVLKHEIYK